MHGVESNSSLLFQGKLIKNLDIITYLPIPEAHLNGECLRLVYFVASLGHAATEGGVIMYLPTCIHILSLEPTTIPYENDWHPTAVTNTLNHVPPHAMCADKRS